MGMHFGLLAASATQQQLLAELERHTGDFRLGDEAAAPFEVGLASDDDGWVTAIGERDGRSFLLDTSYVLSDSPDMIISMSERLGVVVGGGAETVSGSYYLTVARDGDLLRHVFVLHAGMTRGMAIGDPLPTEAEHPVEDPDGDGLFAVLQWLDLDASAWLESGPAHSLRYSGTRRPEGGRAEQIRSEHYRRHARPEGEWLSEIQAVEREA
ncbi:hypothetical protein ACQPZX_16975 [Actinoplanes sp. CA-142083]|uniref:hypothetical protein n=1 Tax=Actinoplanes sp. CA-142083 TaxID=3239903 RepID=UPI003D9339BC